MSIYNLLRDSDYYFKTSGSDYYTVEPAWNDNDNLVDLPGNSALFKSKVKLTGKTPADKIQKTIK